MKVGVILASVREGRRGEAFAKWIHALISERPNVRAQLLDLKEWSFPAYAHVDPPAVAEKSYPGGSLSARWGETISTLDGFVVVTPEYNHGYVGSLKNAFDQIYAPWNYKPVAFLGYGGFAGGARAVEQLRQVAVELRMVPTREEVNVRLVGYIADGRGWPQEEMYAKRATAMLDELLWWAKVAKEGRERHPR
ncbi:MAG TPA: NAD(P)H-dependent oxidoreductase [Anaeromyxobacteraceae bacterium]|nr:NAD(P)H-dependent oxidoreductase [Anaeromyxobacteraceae bacterium]